MATAILDLELTGLPASIPVPGEYGHALVLVRFKGDPVGQVRLPVRDGRIGDDSVPLPVELARNCDAVLWSRWAGVRFGAGSPPPDHLPSVTTAVCTRDRPEDLERCLQAISRLDPKPDAVIVVDNAPSSDATRLLVAQHPGVRYVREDRPGLDAARNRALREVTTEIVAFTDDDAMPDPRWLGALLPDFRDPGVLCVTGLTLAAELETEAQEVFEFASGFGRGFRRRTFSWLNQNPFAVGAVGAGVNMALRRKVVTLVGEFDEALDAGTPTRSGGDHAMFTAILTAGYEIVYEPRALTRHRHRRSRKELLDAIH
ncbi:MAG: glycosyltransferase family 2 protein, partial [Gemmatimonadales bacterium]